MPSSRDRSNAQRSMKYVIRNSRELLRCLQGTLSDIRGCLHSVGGAVGGAGCRAGCAVLRTKLPTPWKRTAGTLGVGRSLRDSRSCPIPENRSQMRCKSCHSNPNRVSIFIIPTCDRVFRPHGPVHEEPLIVRAHKHAPCAVVSTSNPSYVRTIPNLYKPNVITNAAMGGCKHGIKTESEQTQTLVWLPSRCVLHRGCQAIII